MAGSRKSTPSRARSSSVTSNVSTSSNKPKATPKSPKSPKSPKATKSPASPSKPTKSGPATPRKSKSASKAAAAEELTPAQIAAVQARPPLTTSQRNTVLPDEDIPVKLQVIQREGAKIIIGRVKLPTPTKGGHGFILKRFDTNAIAASSMFRLAYPFASAEHEEEEMLYLEQRYETDLANGGLTKVYKKARGRPSKKNAEGEQELPFDEVLPAGSSGVRLQGTWIPCADALNVSAEYGLERWARPLIEAKATESESGTAILTPAKGDKVSTPTSGRSKKILQQILDNPSASPTSILRAAKRSKDETSQDVDQKISTTSSLKEYSKRWEHDGANDLDDV